MTLLVEGAEETSKIYPNIDKIINGFEYLNQRLEARKARGLMAKINLKKNKQIEVSQKKIDAIIVDLNNESIESAFIYLTDEIKKRIDQAYMRIGRADIFGSDYKNGQFTSVKTELSILKFINSERAEIFEMSIHELEISHNKEEVEAQVNRV